MFYSENRGAENLTCFMIYRETRGDDQGDREACRSKGLAGGQGRCCEAEVSPGHRARSGGMAERVQ